jgi:uncharacterized repeat protein (TIGR03843 family)
MSEGDGPQADDGHRVDLDTARRILEEGQLELAARMPYSSNATFLVTVTTPDITAAAIYKPVRGERPLWDFPAGLHRREIAAFELSNQLGWDIVPPTVARDGPHGIGSVQLFIDGDEEQHHFTLVEDSRFHADLRRICLFDAVANNTDRKSGHCLLSRWGRIYGIDHGLCFAEDDKLRTVIWDFAAEPIEDQLLADIEALITDDLEPLQPWLHRNELEALRNRAARLVSDGRYPVDDHGHRWPWPLV